MKQQFLNDSGLTELIGYIKEYVKDDQDVKPYASLSVFPKTGEQNIIYIDTTVNASYYWDDTSKTYKALDVQTWTNLTGKPSTFPPEDHNHDDRYFTETEMNSKLAGKADSSHTHKKADITDFPTSMPASDVPAWAKSSTKPTYTKAEVGLGNVDNTADKDKSVKYATSAGSAGTASSVDWSGVKNPPTTYAPSAHTHGSGDITSLSADKITGVIGIDHLPAGALERCKIVADDTARFKLTKSDIQNGDTVKVGTDANAKMYFVIDDTKLSSEAGYTIYTAGSATSVPWSGVTGKPSTFAPSAHTHDDRYYTESEINSKLAGKSDTGHTHDDRYYTESEMNAKLAGKSDASHSHDLNTMINTLTEGTAAPTDNDYYIAQYAGGGTTTTTYHRRLHSALWSYIKGKADSVYQAKGSYAASSHTHTIAQVSNLQSILDSKASASHTHTIANVTGLQSALDGKAASSHTHSYLPLSGGTMNGAAFISWPDTGNWSNNNSGVKFPVNRGGLQWNGQSDGVSLYAVETGNDNLELYLKFTDDDSNGLSIINSIGTQTARIAANGNITASSFIGNLSGNASTATNVAWSGVTGKPSTFTPSSHKHTISDITNISSASVSYATTAGTANSVAWNNVSGKPGSLPASDVYAWAKASSKPSYSWSEISGKPSTFTPSSHTHNYAGSSSAGGNANWANGASYANYANKIACNPTEDKSTNGLFMFQYSENTTICPDSAWWSVVRTQHPGYNNGYWQEMAYRFDSDIIKFRRNVNGSKSAWKTIAFTDSKVSSAGYADSAGSANSVAWGNVSGRPSSMPASDVYSWAKSSSKPSYSWSEISGRPSSLPANGGNASTVNGHTVNANVPAGAVFTDTNTWRPVVNNLTSTSTDQSLSAAQGKILKDKLDKLIPIGYIFIWNNRKLTNFDETLSGAPALTSAQAVHDYFGFGTWQYVGDTFLYGNPNSQGGASTVSLGVGNMPSHTHSIPALSGWAAGNGAHTHNVRAKYTNNCATKSGGSARANGGGNNISDYRFGNTDSQGAHGHNVSTNASTTGSNGSGSAFSIMPPYKGVYIWQRIA